VFDPHGTHLPNGSTGVHYDLTASADGSSALLADAFADQWAPFKGIFGCDGRGGWGDDGGEGTLFRLPLRTKAGAAKSAIRRGKGAAPVRRFRLPAAVAAPPPASRRLPSLPHAPLPANSPSPSPPPSAGAKWWRRSPPTSTAGCSS